MGIMMKPGRPLGSKTTQVQAIAKLTRCTICGSTERERYTSKNEIEHGGSNDDGPFTHIVWRHTQCSKCGQHRIDKSFENRTATET